MVEINLRRDPGDRDEKKKGPSSVETDPQTAQSGRPQEGPAAGEGAEKD